MLKKHLLKGIAYACFAAGIGLGAASQAQAVSLKLVSESASENSPTGRSLAYWGEKIQEYSNGEIDVKLYYQNQLGGQQEVFDLFMGGAVDGMLTWPMTNYDKRMGLVYTPYMLTDWDDALEAYTEGGWLFSLVEEIMEDNNVTFLGPWPEGFNGIATSGQCVSDISDKEKSNLKLRAIPVYPFPQVVQALGYQTASVDWTELYTALQTGVVDGDSGNVIYHDYEYFRDILDCYVRTKHMFMTAMYIMNSDSFNQLSEEHQEAIRKASIDAVNQQFLDAQTTDNEYVEKAKAAGMRYVEPSADELNEMVTVVRETIWPKMGETISNKVMDTVIENAKSFN